MMPEPTLPVLDHSPPLCTTRRTPAGFRSLRLTARGQAMLYGRPVAIPTNGVAETATIWVLPEATIESRETIA